MLLSFKPDVYKRIYSGRKKIEYRRTFPDEEIKAYMYISSPVCAITGIIYLGKRESLIDLEEEYRDNSDVVLRIHEYRKTTNYAMLINEFHETNEISLDKLREDIEGFVVPQMYYYLEKKPLLHYLKENIKLTGYLVRNQADKVDIETLCIHQ